MSTDKQIQNLPTYIDETVDMPASDMNNLKRHHQINYDIANTLGIALNTNSNDEMYSIPLLSRKYAFTVGGSANAITLTTATPYNTNAKIKTYVKNLAIKFKITTTNTGATTINIDSVGSKDILQNGTTLSGGELKAGAYVELVYNGVAFEMTEKAARSLSSLKKFAVNSSAVDLNGYASFINKVSDSEISFNVTASNPLIYTFASGTSQVLESLPNIDNIPGDGNYIVLIEEGSPTATLVNQSLNSVDEGLVLPAGIDGDYFTTINPLKSYKKVNGSWIETNYVQFGGFPIVGGVMGTAVSVDLNKQLINTKGYTYLDNGLILQYGFYTGGTTNTFPVPFPNAVLSVNVNIAVYPSTGQTMAVYNTSSTNFSIRQIDINNTGQPVSAFYMFAIGY